MSALAQRIGDHSQFRAANDDCFNGGLRTRTKYTYDALDRLDLHKINGTTVLDMDYQSDGNIDYKTYLGAYTYGASAGPHAVTGTAGATYQYDANGNMTNRDGDAITWYAHNLPKKINYGSDSAEFWYGPDRGRYKQVAISGGSTVTTRYVGQHFEVETRGGLTISRHWILAGGEQVALYERRSDGTFLIRYPHRDHQGNIVTTANQKWEYEPFGMRSRTIGSGADDTERGFTGHEHLDSVALVHMNGRVQDPVLGRFVSADPFVQAPYFSQSLNRYAYVWNNPASLVDPSGFDADDLPGSTPKEYPIAPPILPVGCLGSSQELCDLNYYLDEDTRSQALCATNFAYCTQPQLAPPLPPQGGESCGWSCLVAASSIPQHWYDSVLAQLNYVSGGLALWNVETFGGGPVVDRSSAAYQQGERSMAGAYTLATLGAGAYEQGLQGAVGAIRTSAAPEALIGRIAQQHADSGVQGLAPYLSQTELGAVLSGSRATPAILGQGVHRATAASLQASYPGQYVYLSRAAYDFVHVQTGQALELTTFGQAASHAKRGADLVLYNLK